MIFDTIYFRRSVQTIMIRMWDHDHDYSTIEFLDLRYFNNIYIYISYILSYQQASRPTIVFINLIPAASIFK